MPRLCMLMKTSLSTPWPLLGRDFSDKSEQTVCVRLATGLGRQLAVALEDRFGVILNLCLRQASQASDRWGRLDPYTTCNRTPEDALLLLSWLTHDRDFRSSRTAATPTAHTRHIARPHLAISVPRRQPPTLLARAAPGGQAWRLRLPRTPALKACMLPVLARLAVD